MQHIRIGNIEIIADPKSNRPSVPGDAPGKSDDKAMSQTVSLAEAQKLAEFTIWQPLSFPWSGMELVWVTVLSSSDKSGSQQVFGLYAKYRSGDYKWLVLEQHRIMGQSDDPDRMRIPFEVTEGIVDGGPAVFFVEAVTATGAPSGQISILNCLWEREGFLMQLQGPNLSTDDIVRVAESLG